MTKFYFCFLALCGSLFFGNNVVAQNNLAPGDLAITSYQSDLDLSNSQFGGTTNREDRFSFVVLKPGGLAAGTVIYFTDRGWSGANNDFIVNTEGTIQWTVPAGGVPQGTEVFFISTYVAPVVTWTAYLDEAGTQAISVASNSTADNMEFSTAGDQLLIYQTGPTSGPAGAFGDGTRRFIAGIHANVDIGTSNASAWDGPAASGGNQSSLPPGLTGGTNAIFMAVADVEVDNGKYACSVSGATCPSAYLTAINNPANWTLSNSAFAIGTTSAKCSYQVNSPVTITTQPSAVSTCSGRSATFTVAATGTPTPTYVWQWATDAAFTTPNTITDGGVYSGATTNMLTISDVTGFNGRYYRAVVTNTCGSVNSTGALLTVTVAVLPTTAQNITQTIPADGLFYGPSCNLISRVQATGVAPISGTVNARVWIEGSVPTVAGQPFVARHYEITPTSNASTATGTITLYFTQAEFNAYNTAIGGGPQLPTNAGDATGKANLRVGKYVGQTNNGTGLPGSYTGQRTIIDPVDANIIWNATASRWEVTFDVTGFSGFIVHTASNPLPVQMNFFTGNWQGSDVLLQWQTAAEVNHDYFEIEKSVDGISYGAIGRLTGNSGVGIRNYAWLDANASGAARLYYRLKIVSLSGAAEYSDVVIMTPDQSARFLTRVSPNPFRDQVQLGLNLPAAGKIQVRITDITGRVMVNRTVDAPRGFSTLILPEVSGLASGTYVLNAVYGGQSATYKLVK
jgi:hypothetical protein